MNAHVLAGLGNDAAAQAMLDRAWPWSETILFGTTIAAGGNATGSTRNDNDGTFIACRAFARVFIPTAATAVALSEFADEGSTTTADNTFAQLGMARIEIAVQGRPWYRSPIPVNLMFGTGAKPLLLAFRPRIAPGATITAKLFNDSGQSCQAIIGWEGFKVPA